MTREEKLEAREAIVLRAMFLKQSDPDELDTFDAMVCKALGIDKEADPPHFIFDALSAS